MVIPFQVDRNQFIGQPFFSFLMKPQEIHRYAVQMVKDNGPRAVEEMENDLKRVKDALKLPLELPEYRYTAINNNPPEVYVGDRKRRAGKIAVKITGGTSGPKKDVRKAGR